MNKLAVTAATLEGADAAAGLDGSPAAPARGKRHHKNVEYKVKLAGCEHAQLMSLRESCRAAGISASKSTLLRAAVALLNAQSSLNIEAHLQQLTSLKAGSKKKSAPE